MDRLPMPAAHARALVRAEKLRNLQVGQKQEVAAPGLRPGPRSHTEINQPGSLDLRVKTKAIALWKALRLLRC
jgi:hypothetical protein